MLKMSNGTNHMAEAQERLDRAGHGASLHDAFAGCDDDLWVWCLTEGRAALPKLAELLPSLPDGDTQRRFTGKADADAFRTSVAGVRVFKDAATRMGLDLSKPDLRIADIGCGWGRITQTLLREAPPERLTGVDVMGEAIEICRGTGLRANLMHVEPWPPSAMAPESLDLIVAYSVFSHLGEDNHWAWMREFHRALRPGGVVAVTTRPREFIQFCETLRQQDEIPPHARGAAVSFVENAMWLGRYDKGEFCFDTAGGGGGGLTPVYGEACISPAYIERVWTTVYDRVAFIPIAEHGAFDQHVLVAAKGSR
ncbi:MAG: class I SAM-dependent methyltransferase [Planctomycetota bacterium]